MEFKEVQWEVDVNGSAGAHGAVRPGALARFLGSRRLTTGIFVFYLVVLTWIILFKMQLSPDILGTVRSINLIPLAGATVINGAADYREVVQNVLAFVPFGLFMGMLAAGRPWWRALVPVAATSLAFEVLQYVLAVGMSDITDLLANTLGGAIGLGLYVFVRLAARSDTRALRACNTIALVCGLVLALLVVLLVIVNL